MAARINIFKNSKFYTNIFFLLLLLPFIVALLFLAIQIINRPSISNQPSVSKSLELETSRVAEIQGFSVKINEKKEIKVNDFISLLTKESFISNQDGNILIAPGKYDSGIYTFEVVSKEKAVVYLLEIATIFRDFTNLDSQIRSYLGNLLPQYGIYIYDLISRQEFSINSAEIFPSASIAKIPIAILVMKDIEAGKYTLETTIPINSRDRFSMYDDLGELPNGTPVTIRKFLEKMIRDSNNTAWLHLHSFLDGAGTVNRRTIDELGVNPYFLDPLMATAYNVGKVFGGIYKASYLSRENSDYLIYLMETALPWARDAISQGLPANTRFANKIGTLDTGDLISFEDAAIIWTDTTDYVLVIMEEGVDWLTGKEIVKDISTMVYNFFNI